ncbi:AcrR family transcriptional regulator [Rhizobium leguminosarum]|uniref:AcrR family transcriptional regulator n=1 Tax=Rhizobium leguminosarum TaxID=384 RepID=A0A7Z0DZM6_RHILE|nr:MULTISPECIES: TetR/AcrR family transcriptional regulator [Rhizobium]MBB3648169.1 AcrR family transcriptional regulator [Rhizobium sp. BK619]NYJ11984.1 AcrR family transcriptional regulator [Rhizobium leguminosarum]
MSNAHHRKKQPVLVRQQLLDVAARLAASEGMAAVTLDAVSAASSVSKGGLLHHFPTKNALLDALFESLLQKFDADIEELMRGDPLPQGRFTRAYLRAVSGLKDRPDDSRSWTQVTIALLAEPRLRLRWRQWVQARAEEYVGTDSSLDAQVVRFAADGLWFADTLESHDIDGVLRRDLIDRLVELTGK